MSQDIHITTLCALAMGYKIHEKSEQELPISVGFEIDGCRCWKPYDPLHSANDLMELIIHFRVCIFFDAVMDRWQANIDNDDYYGTSKALPEAVVGVVAKLQEAKTPK